MAKIFEIDNEVRQLMADAIDDLIDQIGKDCKLVYPPKLVPCTNCSLGRWKTGGPMPFTFGVCPLCQGQAVKATENSEVIRMLVSWNVEPDILMAAPVDLRHPNSIVRTKGYIGHLPKVKQCDHMQIVNVDPYIHYNFKLYSEPIDPGSIVQGRYFIALWKRI